jgi:SAM-dependent MidA family methyltransferase
MTSETPIPFEEFMRRALHDPAHGYYARRITGVGRRGDFTTAPMLSEMPARAIANWATRALAECGCRDLIEIGPGEGKLAAAVMKHLPWHVRWRTRLHLVETSAPLADRQKNLLGKSAVWHDSPAAALDACRGKAVIFSNELVDAFPVKRFCKSPDGWRELAVAFDPAGNPLESLLPPAPLPDSSGFSDNHPPSQWIEVHESYRLWLATWMPHWKFGRMLTIDYGSTADTLYHRRPRGTLRGYLMHQRMEGADIYQNPGRQDLTADVNFTDLIRWSEPWTNETELCDFATFLQNHASPSSSIDHDLTNPEGAGSAFLVLDQRSACSGGL